MNHKHSARDFLAGAVSMVLAAALIVPAGAALTGKTIQVFSGVEIYVDGAKMEPKDANGSPVDTFVYNGTTYVPLRAVSQSLGKAVNWDGENQRVYIGEVPGEKQYLLDVCPPYLTYGYNNPTTFSMGGKQYSHGFTLDFTGYALFNLDGQYSTLDLDIGYLSGNICDTDILIFLDGNLSQTLHVGAEDLPKHVSIPLNNALQLKIERSIPDGVLGNTSHYGFANGELN